MSLIRSRLVGRSPDHLVPQLADLGRVHDPSSCSATSCFDSDNSTAVGQLISRHACRRARVDGCRTQLVERAAQRAVRHAVKFALVYLVSELRTQLTVRLLNLLTLFSVSLSTAL